MRGITALAQQHRPRRAIRPAPATGYAAAGSAPARLGPGRPRADGRSPRARALVRRPAGRPARPAGRRTGTAGPGGRAVRSRQARGPRLQVDRPARGHWQALARPGEAGPSHMQPPGGGLWPGGLLVPLSLLLLHPGPVAAAPQRASAADPRRRAADLAAAADAGESLGHSPDPGRAARPDRVRRAPVDGRARSWRPSSRPARWPVTAADLVPVALTAFAVRGFMIAASSAAAAAPADAGHPALRRRPGQAAARRPCWPGRRPARSSSMAAWLVPRTIGRARPARCWCPAGPSSWRAACSG